MKPGSLVEVTESTWTYNAPLAENHGSSASSFFALGLHQPGEDVLLVISTLECGESLVFSKGQVGYVMTRLLQEVT